MKQELQEKLFAAGPELYRFRALPCPQECLMGWGFDCPDEWFASLLALTRILEFYNRQYPENAVHARQVKSKFGGLSFYTDHPIDDELDFTNVIIREFEQLLCSSPSLWEK